MFVKKKLVYYPHHRSSYMKALLNFLHSKTTYVLELLTMLPFFRKRSISSHKAKVLSDLKQSVKEMHLVKEGKLIARDADELFNEL